MKNGFKTGWYVLYVQFKHEKHVEHLLTLNGIDAFLPLIRTVSQWKDRKKKILKPLFPCYIFVNIKSRAEFYRALTNKGVVNYLSFGDTPALLKQSEICNIKGFLGIEDLSQVEVKGGMPNVGEKATIQHGPLRGMKCIIEKIDDRYKIRVNVESIKYQVSAVLPMNYLNIYPSSFK
ncbi:MAG TPA: UpxY family transcription antiterminator [Gillisia sp.]|nr:UpxY family transcription antiterminator [Gillisia sp.]